MKRLALTWIVLLPLLLAACAGAEGKAEEMIGNAQFEEAQGNYSHATQLYQRVLDRYPDTKAAHTAQERLQALEKLRD